VPAKGTTIVVSNVQAVITWSSSTTSWYGCLRAVGRRWLLYSNGGFGASASLTSVALAGRFAALQFNSSYKREYCANWASVYDLATGKSDPLFSLDCEPATPPNADSLSVNASGFAAWRATQLRVPRLKGVSCPSVKLCVAVDTAGDVVTSTNPTAGPSAWHVTYVDITALTGVSCPSAGLCVGVDDSGNVVTSSNPSSGASQWTVAHVPMDTLSGVSCPSASLCVTIDGAGNVATSTNPTGGASAWKAIRVDQLGSPLGVSCPSTSLCVGVDDFGHVITSRNPTGGAGAWTVTKGNAGWLNAVSCPTASLCAAVDSAGNVITSSDPIGGAGAWTSALIDPPNCAGTPTCLARQIYAHDNHGTHLLDKAPPGPGSSVANLNLSGNVLTWTHGGTRHQITLQ
jgi:hypothetical protein